MHFELFCPNFENSLQMLESGATSDRTASDVMVIISTVAVWSERQGYRVSDNEPDKLSQVFDIRRLVIAPI